MTVTEALRKFIARRCAPAALSDKEDVSLTSDEVSGDDAPRAERRRGKAPSYFPKNYIHPPKGWL